MAARVVSATFDLRHDCGKARDLRATDDTRAELRPDDAAMHKLFSPPQLAGRIEEREARRGAAAARRPVDLAVREHRDIALDERRSPLDRLEEDDTVDVSQLGLERMDELAHRLELTLDVPAELDEAWQIAGLHREGRLHRGIEGPGKGDGRHHPGRIEPLASHESRNVPKPNGRDAALFDQRHRR